MALGKRKRRGSKHTEFDGDVQKQLEHDITQQSGLTPFTVEVLRNEQSRPKSRPIDGKCASGSIDRSSVKRDPGISPESTTVCYAIQPGEKWESMKKYKTFIGTQPAGTKRLSHYLIPCIVEPL